jgi:hypothetical protein
VTSSHQVGDLEAAMQAQAAAGPDLQSIGGTGEQPSVGVGPIAGSFTSTGSIPVAGGGATRTPGWVYAIAALVVGAVAASAFLLGGGESTPSAEKQKANSVATANIAHAVKHDSPMKNVPAADLKPAEGDNPAAKPVPASQPAKVKAAVEQVAAQVKRMIQTLPAGAEVFDGQTSLGWTPVSVQLPAQGTRDLTIRFDGYLDETLVLTPEMAAHASDAIAVRLKADPAQAKSEKKSSSKKRKRKRPKAASSAESKSKPAPKKAPKKSDDWEDF